ncbi:hypothetical protein [Halonatronum saccharophilum]|uniref:hypothetical protein n=1 Tax=Halonatronum saccharophilum TaxID=150060 RepID=UPI0004BA8F01|nr:hypothetical protein [Halonatronum saccharophilum]
MKPILFNTDMVRAILEGAKTQTRRPIKSPTGHFQVCCQKNKFDKKWVVQVDENEMMLDENVNPPYEAGDILYVRETFIKTVEIELDSGKKEYHYRATPDDMIKQTPKGAIKWKPSIHMPKEAARIFLKVTDVRIERLQDMWNKDAIAEGFWGDDTFNAQYYFCVTWDGMYKTKGYGWGKNPWVWVIEFERLEQTKQKGGNKNG